MSVVDPFLEDKNTEAFEGAIEWLKLNLGQTTQQWCASTSRRTVDQYILFAVSDTVNNSLCSIQDALDLSKPLSLDNFRHELIVLFLSMSSQ